MTIPLDTVSHRFLSQMLVFYIHQPSPGCAPVIMTDVSHGFSGSLLSVGIEGLNSVRGSTGS